MSQTFGEFIKECENWQYSAEAFEMYKEAAELDLACHYYESLLFAIDNHDSLDHSFYVMSEGTELFTEAIASANASVSQVQQVEENIGSKADALRKKIVDKICKFLKVLLRFWNRIKSKFIKNDDMSKIISQINGVSLVKEDVETIIREAEGTLKNAEFTIIGGRSGTRTLRSHKSIKLSFADDNGQNSGIVTLCSGYIMAALDDTVTIEPKGGYALISPEKYIEFGNELKDSIKGKSKTKAKEKIQAAVSEGKNGITINVGEGDMNDIAEQLQELLSFIEKAGNSFGNKFNRLANNAISFVSPSTDILNDVNTMIQYGQRLMVVMNIIGNYRIHMTGVIAKIVKSYNMANKKNTDGVPLGQPVNA